MNNENYIYKVLDVKQEFEITSKPRKKAQRPQAVAEIINDLLGIDESCKEHFVMLGFNTQLEVNVAYKIHTGTLTATMVHPREAFQVAIMNNCSSVIFAHNHPSGSLKASDADIKTSLRLKLVGQLLQIEVLDSLIITKNDVISLEDNDYLDNATMEDVANLFL